MPSPTIVGLDLEHDHCYAALRSRDPRFDGRVFVGVHTTGIYCRPVCPSRTPKAANVSFYGHPAAAEDAGFRPCRRCRPETAPGSTAWRGGSAVVDRALRLIDRGVLDHGSVDDLAGRLHVGGRHLRRLFAEHLGTSPDAVARSRRAHLARQLLADTDLRVADVAHAAGFGSVRQHNDVIRATFHATPTELRRRGPSPAAGVTGGIRLRLQARQPFAGGALLDWFGPRAVPGLEVVGDGAYRRLVRVEVGDAVHRGSVAVVPADDGVVVEVDLPPATPLAAVVGQVRRLFDLDADPASADADLAADPILAPAIASAPGRRVPGTWTGFEAGVRAIVGQQVSVPAATTVLGRIVAAYGDHDFPAADALVDADLEPLGIFHRRAESIRALAREVVGGRLDLDGATPHDELVAALVALPGIGPWTAEYLALRLGEPDAFPAGDLHLRRVLGASEAEARTRSQAWRPWRARAAMHLWSLPMPDRPASDPEERS